MTDLLPFVAPLLAAHPRGAWLALDTSTPQASLALLVAAPTPRLQELTLPAQVVPSEGLFAALLGLLADEGVAIQDLDGLVVGLGPGSFTGLRVGLASAKGIALGTGCPLYGTSSLGLAASGGAPPEVRVVIRDARRAQAYVGVYEARGPGGAATEVLAPRAVPTLSLAEYVHEALAAALPAGEPLPGRLGGAQVAVVGDFAEEVCGRLSELGHTMMVSAPTLRAAYALVREQSRLITTSADDVVTLAPHYLQEMLVP